MTDDKKAGELDENWEPDWPDLINDASKNRKDSTGIVAASQLRAARVFDKRSKEIDSSISRHAERIEALTSSLDSFSKATANLYAETRKSIDEIATKLGAFIDTIKTESASSATLTREMLNESKSIRLWTAILAFATVLLAGVTAWMAVSTADLAKQGQLTQVKELEQLNKERAELQADRRKFEKERKDWESQHKATPVTIKSNERSKSNL